MRKDSDQPTVTAVSPHPRSGGWIHASWRGGAVDGDLPREGAMVLGRGDDCDLVIAHPSVSRRHARLHVGARAQLSIEDLGSANGTSVTGQRIAPRALTRLDPQMTVQLGEVTLLIRAADDPAPVVERGPGTLASAVAEVERARIVEALERCAGNQTRAAKLLGVSRRTLVGKMTEYALPRPLKRSPDE
jgi:pSer/pThr/pTyr-binding forkhead associated (FHA) protein